MDRIYFDVTLKSPAALLLDSYHDSVKKQYAWAAAFFKKHAITNIEYIGCGDHLIGISPKDGMWDDFLTKYPCWRRKTARGRSYAVPRRQTPEQKALAFEWRQMPGLVRRDYIKGKLTGVTDFLSWLSGMASYGIGWAKCKDHYVVAIPYCAVKSKSFKPLDGCTRAPDQDKAREAYERINS